MLLQAAKYVGAGLATIGLAGVCNFANHTFTQHDDHLLTLV
jgi:hypothetical protein